MTTQTWNLDTTHSSVAFTVRHMVVAKVHGRFSRFEGTLTLPESGELTGATAEVRIDAASIDTQVEARDNHLRSADFFDVERFPRLTFRSREVTQKGKNVQIAGDLTLHGVTRPVVLETEYLGRMTDPFGTERVAFSASTRIDRKDFGLTWNQALEAGGVLVGERIDITLEVQAVKAAAAKAA
ncbi:YceI family protein [Aggregicoccus sp. 17bor-14]|uniref:YceI family protein n=1 Tax=Myxococcaceae TaxID=31 RepID=UPI00129C7B6E|nr:MULTISPECIES: YceI family protein [Myxococcaceae]MBF5045329.1 YceI family protein [Simulacricoccus sp. 17bor-14]MRI91071.1 YceI family protein [Aggregicoccus sp. 17bor-14]